MNINIEKTVLSSLMNDHLSFESQQINKQYISSLDKQDFQLSVHQLIFSSIVKLDNSNMPISEDFIHNIIGDNYHLELINILTSTPVSDLSSYIKILKENRYKRELLAELEKGKNGLDIDISKIQNQINSLDNLSALSENKKIDDSFINFFDSYNLDPNKVKDLKVEYLYHNMIVKNEVTMIAAKPSSGKSLTAIAFTNLSLIHI